MLLNGSSILQQITFLIFLGAQIPQAIWIFFKWVSESTEIIWNILCLGLCTFFRGGGPQLSSHSKRSYRLKIVHSQAEGTEKTPGSLLIFPAILFRDRRNISHGTNALELICIGKYGANRRNFHFFISPKSITELDISQKDFSAKPLNFRNHPHWFLSTSVGEVSLLNCQAVAKDRYQGPPHFLIDPQSLEEQIKEFICG